MRFTNSEKIAENSGMNSFEYGVVSMTLDLIDWQVNTSTYDLEVIITNVRTILDSAERLLP